MVVVGTKHARIHNDRGNNGALFVNGVRKGYLFARPFGPRAEYHRLFCYVNPLTGLLILLMGDIGADL
jgi:hypothetical protein